MTTAMLLACTLLRAADKQLAVVVWYDDEELFSFYVSDNPQISVEEGYAVIQSEGEYPVYQVDKTYYYPCIFMVPLSETKPYRISFEERSYRGDYYYSTEDYVDAVEKPTQNVKPHFAVHGRTLSVAGLEAGLPVSVCSADGKELVSTRAGQAGSASLLLPQHKGTAVVKAGSLTFKILLR